MAVPLLAHAKDLLDYTSPPARSSAPSELVGTSEHTEIFRRAKRVHFNLLLGQHERQRMERQRFLVSRDEDKQLSRELAKAFGVTVDEDRVLALETREVPQTHSAHCALL
jgi:hypothetical protein